MGSKSGFCYGCCYDSDFPQVSKIVDRYLVGGSAIFGIGWGIAGFCPGAAIPALGTGRWEVILFLASVVAGFALRRVLAPTPKAVV